VHDGLMLRHAAIPDNYRLSQKNEKYLCVEWAVDHFLVLFWPKSIQFSRR